MEPNQDRINNLLEEESVNDKKPKKESNFIGFIVLTVVIVIGVLSGHEQRQQREQFQQRISASPSIVSETELKRQANTQFCEETQREKALAGGYYDKDMDYSENCP